MPKAKTGPTIELNDDEAMFLSALLQQIPFAQAVQKMLAASIQTKLEEAQGS